MIISFARRIYSNTPWGWLRRFYYLIFSTIVRNHKIKASVDGIRYKLDLGEMIDLHLLFNRYEPEMIASIERLCRPGFTVLDIGANVGAHALRMAKVIGEAGRVYAFEPTDYAYKKLVYNISLNQFKNICPVQAVLSDKNLPRQSIHFRSSWPTTGKYVIQESIVDFIKLDDWCKDKNLDNIDLIKLDVDGNEYSVIMGAGSLLTTRHPPILMEVWGPNFSDPFKNPFIVLKKFGYRFFHINMEKEYVSVDDLKAIVSSDGKLLDYSFNIIARH